MNPLDDTPLSADRKLPMLHLDGAALPPALRLSAFESVASGYSVHPLSPPGEDFQVDCRAWQLRDLVITANRISAVRIERTLSHIRADGRDTYSFILLRRGNWSANIDTGFIQVASGQIGIMDFASTWQVEGTDQENIMIVVPRATVEEIAPGAPPLNGRVLAGAGGRLLAEHMFALVRHLPETAIDDVYTVQHATMSLLSAALGALKPEDNGPFQHRQRALGSKVLAYIEERLTDPELSVETICRNAAVGRATLYRAFQSAGGVATYIQRRRLEAAHARIAEGDGAGMAEIADLYCFSSPAHFSTAFRRHFGYTPIHARSSPVLARDVGTVFEGWRKIIERTAAPPEA
jgi:AraC-like DNA-binding protein